MTRGTWVGFSSRFSIQGRPCTVLEFPARFLAYVDGQIAAKDSNKVRIVMER